MRGAGIGGAAAASYCYLNCDLLDPEWVMVARSITQLRRRHLVTAFPPAVVRRRPRQPQLELGWSWVGFVDLGWNFGSGVFGGFGAG